MNIETIKNQVIEMLEDICTEKIIDVSLSLLDDLSMDSLRMVMMLVMLEDTFGIELDESDMNPFALKKVEDVIFLAAKYLLGSGGEENGEIGTTAV